MAWKYWIDFRYFSWMRFEGSKIHLARQCCAFVQKIQLAIRPSRRRMVMGQQMEELDREFL